MNTNDLHYSSFMAISKKDAKKIRTMLLELIQNTEKIIKGSGEEELHVLLFDYFNAI